MQEKLNELLKDEAFVKELLEKETAEEAQKLLASKGIELTIEQLEAIQKVSKAQNNEELGDEQLEQVAGGFSIGQVDFEFDARRLALKISFPKPSKW